VSKGRVKLQFEDDKEGNVKEIMNVLEGDIDEFFGCPTDYYTELPKQIVRSWR